ncbi:MAG TPA: formaldehyde-activating enzyme [Thermoleophilia bacterium]|nr:formaldehyde-activating enzyme [Thermoleophilia bacterium]
MNEVLIGESFVGDGADAAHINTVLGRRDGPVGAAWATALATPREGHVPFMVVLQPGLAIKPFTLFVNKAAPASETHGLLTWGAAQAGVAAGVTQAVADGVIAREAVDDLVLIAAVWVNPAANDEETVFANNREATLTALRNAAAGLPELDDLLAVRDEPRNPFFRTTDDDGGVR